MTSTVLSAGTMVLTDIGAFNSNQDKSFYLGVTDDLFTRVQKINKDVARIFCVNAAGQQLPVPSTISLKKSTGSVVRPRKENYLITWLASYVLYVDGQPYLTLENEKQQVLSGPPNVVSGTI